MRIFICISVRYPARLPFWKQKSEGERERDTEKEREKIVLSFRVNGEWIGRHAGKLWTHTNSLTFSVSITRYL